MTRTNPLVKLACLDKDYLKGWKMFLLNLKCFSQWVTSQFLSQFPAGVKYCCTKNHMFMTCTPVLYCLLISNICPCLLSTTAIHHSHTSPMGTAKVYQPCVWVFLGPKPEWTAVGRHWLLHIISWLSTPVAYLSLMAVSWTTFRAGNGFLWSVFTILPGYCKQPCPISVLHNHTCCPSCNLVWLSRTSQVQFMLIILYPIIINFC